jgi:hypothetical protein
VIDVPFGTVTQRQAPPIQYHCFDLIAVISPLDVEDMAADQQRMRLGTECVPRSESGKSK